MDIRKLQRAIVDGLEDVKGQDIAVFNTEHLSPLFERVIIASGTSNRQTKALASSVRDAVKSSGFPVLRTEGEDNGEWIIVDCGAAVVHLMQPSIREYYHLEEIWGDKPVKMKIEVKTTRLVKASEDETPAAKKKAAKKATSKPASKTSARTAAVKSAPATSATAQTAAGKTATAKRSVAKPVLVAKKAPARSGITRTTGVKAPAKKAPAKKAQAKTAETELPMKKMKVDMRTVADKKSAAAHAAAKKSPAKRAPARAPAKKAARSS